MRAGTSQFVASGQELGIIQQKQADRDGAARPGPSLGHSGTTKNRGGAPRRTRSNHQAEAAVASARSVVASAALRAR
jgi:hypothetical protein